MKQVKIKDYTFQEYLPSAEIISRVHELAAEISDVYRGKEPPLVLSLLNGSFIFAADLCRYFEFECEIRLLRVSSYSGLKSTGELKIDNEGLPSLADRDVLIIEDIIDTGNTLSALVPKLQATRLKSLRICSLLVKPKALQHPINIDFVGFNIPNDFVIGYGLDYDGLGRNHASIYSLVRD